MENTKVWNKNNYYAIDSMTTQQLMGDGMKEKKKYPLLMFRTNQEMIDRLDAHVERLKASAPWYLRSKVSRSDAIRALLDEALKPYEKAEGAKPKRPRVRKAAKPAGATVGQLRALKKAKGWNQRELAVAMEYDKGAMSRVLRQADAMELSPRLAKALARLSE